MKHKVAEYKLKNGSKGLIIDIPEASVTSLDIVFRAGDYLSPIGKTDTAHIMEHLVLGANKKYPDVKEFSREFTKYGAYNNAYTGDYLMGYEAECESSESERIIDLLCVAIESPLFRQIDFEAEVGNVREELKMRRNNDESELALYLENALGLVPKSYKEREKELDVINISDIEDHYKRTHTSSNMRFVIAGPLGDELQKSIIDRLENIKLPTGDGYKELPNELPANLKQPLVISNKNLDNICYRLEIALPHTDNWQVYDSANALFDILFDSFHSRVFGELREKGLVYGINGSYYETKNNMFCVITGQVQAENIQSVFEITHREIAKIAKEGLPQSELEELRKKAYGEIQRIYQTVCRIGNWYRHSYVMRDTYYPFDKFQQRLDNITSDSIKQIAAQMLNSDTFGLGIMHNPNQPVDAISVQKILLGK